MKVRYIFILFFFSFVSQLAGQIITVKSDFSADSIFLGEQIKYNITVESADDLIIGFPEFVDTITSEIEILGSALTDTSFENGLRILSKSYTVSSFEPGWATVPPQAVSFQTGDFSDTVFTTASLLTVLAPEVDTTLAIKPIKGPVNTPLSLAEILPWAIIIWFGVMFATLIVTLLYLYLKKGKKAELLPAKPLDPAHVIAFRELDLLKSEKLPQNGRVKEYYTRLTEIIREYIARQFSIHAMESTSAEILQAFSSSGLADKKLTASLESLLMLADLVKFAKEDPGMKENEMHMDNAVKFIEQTYGLFQMEVEEESMEDKVSEEFEPLKMEVRNG